MVAGNAIALIILLCLGSLEALSPHEEFLRIEGVRLVFFSITYQFVLFNHSMQNNTIF